MLRPVVLSNGIGEQETGRGLEIRARVGIPVAGTIYYDTKYSDDNNAQNNFNIITHTWTDHVALKPEYYKVSIYPLSIPVISVAPGVMGARGNTWPGSASRDTDRGEIGIKLSLICNHITLWALSSRIMLTPLRNNSSPLN